MFYTCGNKSLGDRGLTQSPTEKSRLSLSLGFFTLPESPSRGPLPLGEDLAAAFRISNPTSQAVSLVVLTRPLQSFQAGSTVSVLSGEMGRKTVALL